MRSWHRRSRIFDRKQSLVAREGKNETKMKKRERKKVVEVSGKIGKSS